MASAPRSAAPRGYTRRAAADRNRRRVRTTANANGPHIGKRAASKARKIRRNYRKIRRVGPATATWGAIAALITLGAVLIQSTASIAAAGVSLGATVAVDRIERRKARTAVPPPPRKTVQARNYTRARPAPGTPGTRPNGAASGQRGQQQQQQQHQSATAKAAAAKAKAKPLPLDGDAGKRPRVCGDNCKRSPKPKSTCRCSAPDCAHGSLAGPLP